MKTRSNIQSKNLNLNIGNRISNDKIPIKIDIESDINFLSEIVEEEYDHKLVRNFGKCYAEIVSKICNYFIHHEDLLCDYRDTGCEIIFNRKMDLKIKYSPIKIEHYSYIEYSNIFLEIPEISRPPKNTSR